MVNLESFFLQCKEASRCWASGHVQLHPKVVLWYSIKFESFGEANYWIKLPPPLPQFMYIMYVKSTTEAGHKNKKSINFLLSCLVNLSDLLFWRVPKSVSSVSCCATKLPPLPPPPALAGDVSLPGRGRWLRQWPPGVLALYWLPWWDYVPQTVLGLDGGWMPPCQPDDSPQRQTPGT